MQRAAARHQLRSFRPRQLAEGVVQRLGGQRRIEPHEGIAQPLCKHDLPVVVAFGARLAGSDFGAVLDRPADAFEPGEGGLFDDGFGEDSHDSSPATAQPRFPPCWRDACRPCPHSGTPESGHGGPMDGLIHHETPSQLPHRAITARFLARFASLRALIGPVAITTGPPRSVSQGLPQPS